MERNTITFTSDCDEELTLEKVHYNTSINGLVSHTAIEQHYINPFENNIEAVYTFPLAPSAVLMGVEIHINNRKLRGTIIGANEADEKYEEAIEEGNRAIMVEKNYDGLYTVSIGNLLSKDKITIILEYTQLLEWNQDRIKLTIPTVIAQKYGNPSHLNLDDTTTPESSDIAQNRFTFDMSVTGILEDDIFEAPSHEIEIQKLEHLTKLKLADKTDYMDRDITIIIESKKERSNRSFALVGKDFEGYSAIASFFPSIDANYKKEAKNVTFVVDCSGSMSGTSITKARIALTKAVTKLDDEDTMNLILFGSHYKSIFNIPVPANAKNKRIISKAIDKIDSDMGGTEMGTALYEAYSQNENVDTASYLFLITDGEIYDHKIVIKNAVKSEMRHFIIGVGYATDSVLLNNIAQSTAGSFENIDPNEEMDQSILNQFKKIDMPKTKSLKVQWPEEVIETIEPKYLYDWDTLFVMATFNKKPVGTVTLDCELENGEIHSVDSICEYGNYVSNQNPSKIARIVANSKMIKLNDDAQVRKLSEQYQLFSEETKYLLIDEVDESQKVDSLPKTYKVKQMPVHNSYYHSAFIAPRAVVRPRLMVGSDSSSEYLDIPCYMRQQDDDTTEVNADKENEITAEELLESIPDYYIEQIVILLNNNSDSSYPKSLSDLKSIGIDREEVIKWIEMQINTEVAINAFIEELLLKYLERGPDIAVSNSIIQHYNLGTKIKEAV